MTVKIAEQFTKTPGGRFKAHGQFSGEEFRETILIPAYAAAKESGESFTIDFDGGYGYPSSFLEEAFGGLARWVQNLEILEIGLVSDEQPEVVQRVREYVCAGLQM